MPSWRVIAMVCVGVFVIATSHQFPPIAHGILAFAGGYVCGWATTRAFDEGREAATTTIRNPHN